MYTGRDTPNITLFYALYLVTLNVIPSAMQTKSKAPSAALDRGDVHIRDDIVTLVPTCMPTAPPRSNQLLQTCYSVSSNFAHASMENCTEARRNMTKRAGTGRMLVTWLGRGGKGGLPDRVGFGKRGTKGVGCCASEGRGRL